MKVERLLTLEQGEGEDGAELPGPTVNPVVQHRPCRPRGPVNIVMCGFEFEIVFRPTENRAGAGSRT